MSNFYLPSRQLFQGQHACHDGASTSKWIYCAFDACLDTLERSIQRVRERVAQGGHDVPDTNVRRRYERSLLSLPAALRLAHEAIVYGNSDEPRKVLETRGGTVVWRTHSEPAWVTRARESLSSP